MILYKCQDCSFTFFKPPAQCPEHGRYSVNGRYYCYTTFKICYHRKHLDVNSIIKKLTVNSLINQILKRLWLHDKRILGSIKHL